MIRIKGFMEGDSWRPVVSVRLSADQIAPVYPGNSTGVAYVARLSDNQARALAGADFFVTEDLPYDAAVFGRTVVFSR